MKIGPVASKQLVDIDRSWRQGDHVLVTGGTGSGKTLLANKLDNMRIARGGSVVVFVCKLRPDETITENYSKQDGWVRWTTWHKRPLAHERKILLWPKVEGKTAEEAIAIMHKEFRAALNAISAVGYWTVHIDEGLFVAHPQYLNLGSQIASMYQLLRSAKGTMITLAQRPSHLPLAIYANITHAFVGHASEDADVKRLADLNSALSSKEMQQAIRGLDEHDFLWIRKGIRHPPEVLNLAR